MKRSTKEQSEVHWSHFKNSQQRSRDLRFHFLKKYNLDHFISLNLHGIWVIQGEEVYKLARQTRRKTTDVVALFPVLCFVRVLPARLAVVRTQPRFFIKTSILVALAF